MHDEKEQDMQFEEMKKGEHVVEEVPIQAEVDESVNNFHNVETPSNKDGGFQDTDGYEFEIFHEDERKRILRALTMPSKCSRGQEGSLRSKNDNIRVRVKCNGMVSQFGEHSGGPSTRSKVTLKEREKCSCPWALQFSRPICDKNILKRIEGNPRIQVKALCEEFSTKFELGMSHQKVARDNQVKYGLLRDYGMELQKSNLGTTFMIDVYPESVQSSITRTFRRIYICLGVLKVDFKVDGTFMKGPYPLQVLTVVCMNSNNVGNVFWSAEHRFCLKNIQENMKIQWKDIEMIDKIWELEKTTTINHYNTRIDELKVMNNNIMHDCVRFHPVIRPSHILVVRFII
ncbi:hypothetical protein LXL04_021029 [Taraxacum kok-saghyz]